MNSKEKQKYKNMVNRYFEEFRGFYSEEQIFYIMLGISTVIWANMKEEEYSSSSNLTIHRILSGLNNGNLLFQDEIERLEREHYQFEGILTGIFNKVNSYRSKSSTEELRNILYTINSSEFSSIDDVRRFINELVKVGNRKSGSSDTPNSISSIIAGIASGANIRGFADYSPGSSLLAIEIFEKMKSNGIYQDVFYYGEEINQMNYMISKLLMIVNDVNNYEIVNKDPLEYRESNEHLKFDFAVCDIPQKWRLGREIKVNDPRFIYSKSARISTDWAFIQNLLYHLNGTGKGVIVGTKGTLVRSNEDEIRRGIIRDDFIECVITLPDNLYEKSSIGAEMIVFNKFKDLDRRNKILFINGSEYGSRLNKNQHAIDAEGISKILECYRYGFEEPGFSKLVGLDKLQEYDYRLNPIEYLEFDVLKNSLTDSISLKEIAEINTGVQITKKDLEKLSEEPTHYFLNVKDINEGKINYDDDTMITFKKFDWIGKYDIQPEDILLTSKGWAVKVAVVGEDFKPSFISGNLTRIRVDPRKYNPYVLYEFLQSEIGMKMLEGLQTGTTIKLLNNSQLERLEIPMFSMGFMNQIGNEIKMSKFKYERTIEEATREFEEKREQLVESLGWRICKNK